MTSPVKAKALHARESMKNKVKHQLPLRPAMKEHITNYPLATHICHPLCTWKASWKNSSEKNLRETVPEYGVWTAHHSFFFFTHNRYIALCYAYKGPKASVLIRLTVWWMLLWSTWKISARFTTCILFPGIKWKMSCFRLSFLDSVEFSASSV